MKTIHIARPGLLQNVAVGVAALMLALSCFFTLSVPRAHAAALTEPQIQAILNLLVSFNVPAATVSNVNVILHKSK